MWHCRSFRWIIFWRVHTCVSRWRSRLKKRKSRALHMNIWCTSHEHHVYFTWTSRALHMNISCTLHEYHMYFTWTSCALHMNITCTSTSRVLYMNITCTSHERHVYFTWTSCIFHINTTWTPREHHVHFTWIPHVPHIDIIITRTSLNKMLCMVNKNLTSFCCWSLGGRSVDVVAVFFTVLSLSVAPGSLFFLFGETFEKKANNETGNTILPNMTCTTM